MVLALMEPWVIALASCAFSICGTMIGAVYWFGRNTPTIADLHELRDLAVLHRKEIKGDLDKLEDDIVSERRDFGEGLAALRQKINDVELEASKVYVRRESWHLAMNQLQESWGKDDLADQQWKLRIEEKIDRLNERMAER